MLQRTLVVVGMLAIAGCNDKKPPEPKDKAAQPPPPPVAADAAAPAPPPKDAVTWQTYTSPAGKFTIDLPGKPAEQMQGSLTLVAAEFGTTSSDPRSAMCGAAYIAKPDGATDAKAMLDGATKHYKDGAKIIEEKDVTLDKNPGRQLIVENSSHRKWMRAYVTDKMIYIVNCGGPFDRAATDGPIALKSLESFKLVK